MQIGVGWRDRCHDSRTSQGEALQNARRPPLDRRTTPQGRLGGPVARPHHVRATSELPPWLERSVSERRVSPAARAACDRAATQSSA